MKNKEYSLLDQQRHFIRQAQTLCTALAVVQQTESAHLHLCPANITFNAEGERVLSQRETQPLAYTSPEQTGRINQAVDYRSDFYSLGVVFYEQLTGQLPFIADDALELMYGHIARLPLAPISLKPELFKPLNDIVLKLLAKNAEDRYQSIAGLCADLQQCDQLLADNNSQSEFTLAKYDVSDRLQFPQKVYGRETEIKKLLKVFERTTQGQSELLLIAGYSGVGKTAFIHEITKPVLDNHGYFVVGKYDQFTRNIPYSALTQALSALIRQLLSESPKRIALWKANLLQALEDNGSIITDVLPELIYIIGPQPAAKPLSPTETQNRFNTLMQRFIAAFACAEHPLVIFQDDLQWVDHASLALLKKILTAKGNQCLLVIGAFRNNEVGPTHPLRLALTDMAQTGVVLNTLELAPLDATALQSFIADTLQNPDAADLVYSILAKTAGNPFFVRQFLLNLHELGLLRFSVEEHCWQWDRQAIDNTDLADNVVDLTLQRLQRLPTDSQRVLKTAACLGTQFSLPLLAAVLKQSADAILAELQSKPIDGIIAPVASVDSLQFRFCHDRLQQASDLLLEKHERVALHLAAGRTLLENGDADKNLFEMADHFQFAISEIVEPAERNRLVEAFARAGHKAKLASAHAAALNYLETGILLADDAALWQKNYALALQLQSDRAECEFVCGHIDAAEAHFEQVLQQAQRITEKVPIYILMIHFQANRGRHDLAVKVGLDGLRKLGIHFPIHPSWWQVIIEYYKTRAFLRGRPIQSLLDLPEMRDSEQLAIMDLCLNISMPALFFDHNLMALIIMKSVIMSLQHGNTHCSGYAYAGFGLLLGGKFGWCPKLTYTVEI